MHMLYQSDSYVVVRFDLPDTADGATLAGDAGGDGARGGLEIVDRLARKEVFIQGELAESFLRGARALAEREPSAEDFDDYIAGFTTLAQQPLALH